MGGTQSFLRGESEGGGGGPSRPKSVTQDSSVTQASKTHVHVTCMSRSRRKNFLKRSVNYVK